MTIKEVYEIVDKIYTKMDNMEKSLLDKLDKKADVEDCPTRHASLKAFNIVNFISIIAVMLSILALIFHH